ncbi:MAG: hypothetical protein VKK42_29965 [Lyngbya sp.]|nr:hypothetical protein [Lyngbya sp.]
MSEVQPENTQKIETVTETPTTAPTVPPPRPSTTPTNTGGVGGFLNSWKFKLGLAVAAILALATGIFIFYYPHTIAMIGLKRWSTESGAQPIDCMMRDTDQNQYVSCSAKLDQKIFPLECGSSLFNIGCRVFKEEILRQ